MKKFISFDLDKELKGLNTLNRMVKSTLGPRGRYVLIDHTHHLPLITKDGVSVAEMVELEDERENAGVKVGRQAATAVDKEVGDFTTQTILETTELTNLAYKAVQAGANPFQLTLGMEQASRQAGELLDKLAIPVKTKEQKIQVATISANNDKELGEAIGSLVHKIGSAPVITEEWGGRYAHEVQEGLWFDRGFIHPVMMTEPNKATYTNPLIWVSDQRIGTVEQVQGLLEKSAGRPLVIIADDIAGDALKMILTMHRNSVIQIGEQRMMGKYDILAIRAPMAAERKLDYLEDICAYTGAVLNTQMGQADRVVATDTRTTITGGQGDVKPRVDLLLALIESTDSEFEKGDFKERLAKLTQGIGVLKIPALTDVAHQNLKKRIEDAVRATQVAVEGGVVAGGGVALANISKQIKVEGNQDVQTGAEIVKEALLAPIKELTASLNIPYQELPDGEGYNILTGEKGKMLEMGIIEAVKGHQITIKKSVEVASELVCTGASIVQKEEKDDKN